MLNKANCPYGRASQGAAYTLLAKLYLNAEVYTQTSKYNECIKACKRLSNRVINWKAIITSCLMPTMTNVRTK